MKRAQKALLKTSNAGIESAIGWLTDHLEDADLDDPIEGEWEMKTQEEIGQAAAETLAGMGSNLTPEEKKAKHAEEQLRRDRERQQKEEEHKKRAAEKKERAAEERDIQDS